MKNRKTAKRKGFTLIELIVVIAILAALTAIIFPSATFFIDQANNIADAQHAKSICNVLLYSHVLYGTVTTDNPWGDSWGYVYVDDDELRASSMDVAKILEENGFIVNADKATLRNAHNGQKELTYPYASRVKDKTKGYSKIKCQSHKKWITYQVTIMVNDAKNLEFYYTASANNASKATKENKEATEAFAHLCQGRSSGNVNIGNGK